MDNSVIIGILGFIFSLLLLVFSAFLLTVKTNNKIGNILLASLLIVTAIDCTAFFSYYVVDVNLTLDILRIKLSGLKEPLLFLYVLSVIYSNFKLKKIHLVHLIPFLINTLILIPNFFLVDSEAKTEFYNDFIGNPEIVFSNYFGRLLTITYFGASIYYVLRYRKLLLENHTNENDFKNYKWLKQYLMLTFIAILITLTKGVIRDSGRFSIEVVEVWRIVLLLYGMFFVFWLIFKALNTPKLFRGFDVSLKTSKEMDKGDLDENHNERISDLKKYMEEHEPYLNPSLTIRNLADQLKVPMRDLSVLINQELKLHFFDFINEYRIEKAKNILSNPSKTKVTVLEILYEVGFNSKSSFNTAFKKHTGKTPTQFRKSVI
ncbi:AraC family transcriptional regulator [Tenacibaculum sp. 190524A05c]|uniref:helix-turn-helix domain-containing protein n=1 Tax=Tenacibaculum platacis TaxID=3137852 RepID=UPI0031FB65C9